jgi:hypothetical protein
VPGPLAARWTLRDLPEVRAGTLVRASVEVENAGTASWRAGDVLASSHWLDERGNPIVWDGVRNELPRTVAPGEHVRLALELRGPIPPGRYRLALDLVDEHRLWFAEAGSETLERDVAVAPRIERRLATLQRWPRRRSRSSRRTRPRPLRSCPRAWPPNRPGRDVSSTRTRRGTRSSAARSTGSADC